MVTLNNANSFKGIGSPKNINKIYTNITEEYRGLSSDEKPILLPDKNGSEFYEMDTKKFYMFDGENLVWLPQ